MAKLFDIEHSSGNSDFAQTYREWRRSYYSRFPEFWGTWPGESMEERNTTEFYHNLLRSSGSLPYRTSFHGLDELRVTSDYSVTIRDRHETIEQSKEDLYNNQLMVYQQHATLPTTTLLTEEGLIEANLVHNCFIVAGTPSAIGVRASRGRIFDDYSYFLPICYPRQE